MTPMHATAVTLPASNNTWTTSPTSASQLWFTPVLENNMTGGSYHGYATTDYYKVDPRFGTNEEYKLLIEKAHARGIKIVMDMIFNHCGVEHVWIKDMPSKDWFNNPDHENNFVQTSFKLTPHVDPYTSQYDADQMNDGWFVPSMPDLNQEEPSRLPLPGTEQFLVD